MEKTPSNLIISTVRWTFTPDAPVYNVIAAIRNGSLVFCSLYGAPYRLSLADGSVIWHTGPAGTDTSVQEASSTGGAVIGPDGVVYVTSNELVSGNLRGRVTAFSFEDGTLLWRRDTEYQANNAAAVGPGGPGGALAVAIGVGENPDMPDAKLQGLGFKQGPKEKKARVLLLDASTGEPLWTHELPPWHGWAAGDTAIPSHVCLPDSFGNPAMGGDGTVYVGFESGLFYAIRDKDGDGKISADKGEVSSFDTGNAFQGSPGIAPGMLVATPCNGMLVWLDKTA